jgi:CRP-like cAMP-binding protein
MAASAARRKAGSTADLRVNRLAGLPLFAGVPAAALEAVAVRLQPLRVAAGAVVIREGDVADRFYLIDLGSFAVTRLRGGGAEAAAAVVGAVPIPPTLEAAAAVEQLRTMGPGEVFGEIGLLRGIPRTATVTAATDGALLALDGADFLELVNAGALLRPRLLDLRRGAPGAGY